MLKISDCLIEFGTVYKLNKAVQNGEIYKLEKGIYSKEKDVPEMAVISFKYPEAVFTMRTAFFFHDLTDVIPEKYELATHRDAYKIQKDNIKQYFIPSDYFSLGIEKSTINNYPIKIYNREKLLIELIRYKSKLPFDYYKEIINNYRLIIDEMNIQLINLYASKSPKSNMIINTLQMEVF